MKNRFTEEQIIRVLKESETGVKIKELCRRHGIAQGTFYTWKAKFSGMEVSDAKRLRNLEHEISRLKKMIGELSIENMALKEINSKKW
jgi:putative transposase